MKKITFIFLSILIITLTSIIFVELFIKTTLFVYRNINSDNNYTYIYVLGESPANGAPYFKLSFSKILNFIIQEKIDGKETRIIDLSKPGSVIHHSYIKYFWYRLLHPRQKGIVLAYIGTNNPYVEKKYNNYKTNILLYSNLYNLLNYYISFCINNIFNINDSSKYFANFKFEYEKLIQLILNLGDEPYISTFTKNYSGYHQNIQPNLYLNELNEIDILFFNNDIDKAEKLCNKYIQNIKYNIKSPFLYRLGKIYECKNLISEANNFFLSSNEEDNYHVHIICNIAKKYNIEYIDFFKKLYNSNEVIGFNYFEDEVHLNLRANAMLAYDFAKLIQKKHKLNILDKKDFVLDKLLKKYNYNNNDRLRVYMSNIINIEGKNNYTYKYNKSTIMSLINKINELKIDETKSPNSTDREYFLKIQNKFTNNYTFTTNHYKMNLEKLKKELNKYMFGGIIFLSNNNT